MARCGLKLATFNVQNLGRVDNPDPAIYQSKQRFVADVLRRIDADLAVVDEVREPDSFNELADELPTYTARLLADPPGATRRIQTGILTRLPVLEQGQWFSYRSLLPGRSALEEFRFRRPMPWLRVQLANGETLFAVAVHLKSQRAATEETPESETPRARRVLGRALSGTMRTIEATGLRLLLDGAVERQAADHYAVLGDFNDAPESLTLTMLSAHESDDPADWERDERCRLYRVTQRVPAERAFSYIGQGRRQLLDQILVSQKLSLGIVAVGIENQLLLGELRPPWESASGYPRSDHAPVWASFELPEQQ